MGYTHFWSHGRLTPEQMGDISGSIRKIIAASNVKICSGRGDGKPTLTKQMITFNGKGPDLDHETFQVMANPESEFCKTARKPYDIVVTACLTFLAHDYGFEVSSDGDSEEWVEGVALAAKALGKAYPCPLIVRALMGENA